MAAINPTPPQPPKWQITVTEDERAYLLAAFDFALQFLHNTRQRPPNGAEWPLPAMHYVMEISHLEQVVVSVDPNELRNA